MAGRGAAHTIEPAGAAGSAVLPSRHGPHRRGTRRPQDCDPMASSVPRWSALTLCAALLCGCSTSQDAPPPATTSTTSPAAAAAMLVRELPGLLLDAAAINSMMDATDMEVVEDWSRMFGYNTPGGDCAGAWSAVWQPAYSGSGWMGVRGRSVRKPTTPWNRVVYEAVVAFPLPADAADFYAKQVASWKTCDGRHVDERDLDTNDGSGDTHYSLDHADDTAGMLTMSALDDEDPSLSCQHALTVRNNVAVDIRACGPGVRTQAGAVASAIAAKVPGR